MALIIIELDVVVDKSKCKYNLHFFLDASFQQRFTFAVHEYTFFPLVYDNKLHKKTEANCNTVSGSHIHKDSMSN